MSGFSSILKLEGTSGRIGAAATAALAVLIATSGPSLAKIIHLGATLSGRQEVPPDNSKGTGTLTGTYDTLTRKLNWSVSYSDLTGTPVAAHFHGPALPGKNGPIEVPAPHADKNPIKGNAVLTAKQAKDLLSGKMYFNIHTKAHPAGEIRGQVSELKAS